MPYALYRSAGYLCQNGTRFICISTFFPNEDLRNPRKYFKIRDNEKTASAKVSWYNGLWRITDFGNQGEVNGLSAIDFVKWHEGLEYYDALQYIEQVVIGCTISGGEFKKSRFQPDYEWREVGPDDKKGEYKFTFKTVPSKTDLSAIGRYVTKSYWKNGIARLLKNTSTVPDPKNITRISSMFSNQTKHTNVPVRLWRF